MRKVMPSELILNEPLPWSVYDSHGNLLLKTGYVISIPKHINNLVVRGAYTDAPLPQQRPATIDLTDTVTDLPTGTHFPDEIMSAFARVDALATTLERLHNRLLEQPQQPQLLLIVRGLANAVMEICADNTDILIAACHLDRQHSYLVVQQLLSTAVTEITARSMQMDKATRLSLVCAALTRDIALLPVQQQLDTQTTPLEPAQTAALREHPQRSVEILMATGVSDPVWLELVLQHHERQDGSGYPGTLHADNILEGASVLAVADSYAAMVTPRPNRVGQFPKDVMHTLRTTGAALYRNTVLQQLSGALTDYPPGTLVRLANGKIGFIHSSKKVDGQPDVWLLYNDSGMPSIQPKRWDTANPGYAITDILRVETCRSAHLVMKRMWSQIQGP